MNTSCTISSAAPALTERVERKAEQLARVGAVELTQGLARGVARRRSISWASFGTVTRCTRTVVRARFGPGMAPPSREDGRGGRDARADAATELRSHAIGDGCERRSASKRSRSSPRRSARAHRCGSSSRPWSSNSASCIGQKAPWARPPRRRGRRPAPAGGWPARGSAGTRPQRQRPQPHLELRAERALVVAVDDRQPRALRSPHVVVGAERRQRGGAEVGQTSGRSAGGRQSASKIRLAPGSSLGRRAPGSSI